MFLINAGIYLQVRKALLLRITNRRFPMQLTARTWHRPISIFWVYENRTEGGSDLPVTTNCVQAVTVPSHAEENTLL